MCFLVTHDVGIELGDVIVQFDGKDIKDAKDLPRVVADTPIGKEVPVVVLRKGKQETRMVKLGQLQDDEAPVKASVKPGDIDGDKTVDFGGVEVIVDDMSVPYLDGAKIDFKDTISEQGFTIDNPNAAGSCACGDSFS